MTNWIEWKGGECPVDEGIRVAVKLRDGGMTAGQSEDFDWRHAVMDDDIIAYRVVKE